MREMKVEKTASRGIAIAPAYIYRDVDLTPDTYLVEESKVQQEEIQFQEVKQAVLAESNPVREICSRRLLRLWRKWLRFSGRWKMNI